MEADDLPFVTRADEGWYLNIRVQPGAKKSEITGVVEDALRVRLAAPAVENKANQALVEFMAKKLGLKKNKVSLTSGEKSRQKRLFISSAAAGTEPDWAGLSETENS